VYRLIIWQTVRIPGARTCLFFPPTGMEIGRKPRWWKSHCGSVEGHAAESPIVNNSVRLWSWRTNAHTHDPNGPAIGLATFSVFGSCGVCVATHERRPHVCLDQYRPVLRRFIEPGGVNGFERPRRRRCRSKPSGPAGSIVTCSNPALVISSSSGQEPTEYPVGSTLRTAS
jgi:hypothetical protein